MKPHFAVFGRQPEISLAEWQALKPTLPPPTLCGQAALIEDPDWNGADLMNRLGGTVKLGDIVFDGPARKVDVALLADLILAAPREPRIIFGCSVYGENGKERNRIEMLPLKLKRELKARGHSSRWVTGEGTMEPTPAAVAKLHLTTEGYDIVILFHGSNASVGFTTHVQDADAWSLRDYGRPARDDKSGMLPPKLARIMVNLAQIQDGETILDPFCGSGTIPMEALLITKKSMVIGSDISDRCVKDTNKNLDWLVEQHVISLEDRSRATARLCDAKTLASCIEHQIEVVVTEGYLGPPLTGQEPHLMIEKNVREIIDLWKEFLKSVHPLLTTNGRIIGIWPTFKTSRGFVAVNIPDPELERLGFRLVGKPLLYQRPDQRVGRQIVRLEHVTR